MSSNRKRRAERIQQKLEEQDEPEEEPVVVSAIEYSRRKREAEILKSSRFQKCAICRQAIPVDEISEHMRLELLNPKEKNNENQRRTVIESSDKICANLSDFARNREDVFVGKNEPTPIIERDFKQAIKKSERMIESASSSAVNGAASKAGGGAGGGSSTGNGEMQIMISHPAELILSNSHLPADDLESHLMPEKLFLLRHPGPVALKVQVPKDPASPYNLKGQAVALSFYSASDRVADLKEKLKNTLANLPPHRMRIVANTARGPLHLKDEKKSLAYYNVRKAAVLELSIIPR